MNGIINFLKASCSKILMVLFYDLQGNSLNIMVLTAMYLKAFLFLTKVMQSSVLRSKCPRKILDRLYKSESPLIFRRSIRFQVITSVLNIPRISIEPNLYYYRIQIAHKAIKLDSQP